METSAIRKEVISRFDTRLPKAQKLFFEKAVSLGGYRSLTDFILSAVQEKAEKIMKEKSQILLSQRDAEFFFHAVTQPDMPNQALKEAAEEYKHTLSK